MVTAALAAYWQKYRADQHLAIFKPIQSGEGDREYYQNTFELTQSAQEITPLQYQTPLAPPIAAEQEGQSVNLGLVWQTYQSLQHRFDQILVEGVGGLGTPITAELTVADLARDWRLPTVLVVPVQLGAIGQAIANVTLARHMGLNIIGLILSCHSLQAKAAQESLTPRLMLQRFTQLPVLGVLNPLENMNDKEKLAHAASGLDLEFLA